MPIMNEERYQSKIEEGERLAGLAHDCMAGQDWPGAMELLAQAKEAFGALQHRHWLNFLDQEQLKCLHALGRLEEVEVLAKGIVKGFKKTLDQEGLSRFLVTLAQLFQQEEKDQRALSILRAAKEVAQAERLHESLGPVLANLAFQLQLMGEFAQAIEEYDQALLHVQSEEKKLERLWIFEQLGRCFYGLFRPREGARFLGLAFEGYQEQKQWQVALEVGRELRREHKKSGDQRALIELGRRLRELEERLEKGPL